MACLLPSAKPRRSGFRQDVSNRSDRSTAQERDPNVQKMGSLRRIANVGDFLRMAVAPLIVLGPLSSAMAGDHKRKVWVPVTPVYTVPNSGVAMAPVGAYSVASYSAGTVAGAPMAMATVGGGFGGMYYTSA